MNSRFSKNWNRKNQSSFSMGFIPVILMLLIALGFKGIPTKDKFSNGEVSISLPKGEQFQRLLDHKPVLHLSIGKPTVRLGCGNAPLLQINDKISTIREIPLAIKHTNKSWLYALDEKNPIRAELRSDCDVTMGIIGDVKRELQKTNWVHFNYIQAKKP